MKVLQSGHIGDLVYSLSAVKRIAEISGEPVDFYVGSRLQNTTPNHPSGSYCMSIASYNYIKPLLQYQSYINSVQVHLDEHIDYDLDQFRRENLNLSAGDLRRCQFLTYPELMTDLYEPTIKAPEPLSEYADKILLNFSDRYRNYDINYTALKDKDCIFFGFEQEYTNFVSRWNLNCSHLKVDNALELAQVINSVKLFIGNQSSTYAIAEQLKTKRFLERYYNAPNVIPINNGFDYHNNHGFKTLIKTL